MNSRTHLTRRRKSSNRKTFNLTVACAITGALIASAAGCGGAAGDDTGNSSDDGEVTVAFVQAHMASTFRVLEVEGAEEAAKEAGVSLSVFDSNNRVEDQNRAIQAYANKGTDVIIIGNIQTDSVKPAMDYAVENGSKIVSIDPRVDHPVISAHLGVSNRDGGKEIAKLLIEYAQENSIPLEVGVVTAFNNGSYVERLAGFEEEFEAAGGEIIQTVDSQNIETVSLSVSQALLTANPDMRLVYAPGGPALNGLLSAVEQSDRTDDVAVFGWDLDAHNMEAIDAGYLKALANQPAYDEGYDAVITAAKIARGESFEADTILPIQIVTQETLTPELRKAYTAD